MKKDLRIHLDKHSEDIAAQFELAEISESTAKDFILKEMSHAVEDKDWEAWYTLFGMTCSIENQYIQTDILNHLLLMSGHELHQEITRKLQLIASPSSIPFIKVMLENNFDILKYTCSEDEVIAKWFSHALASINTKEAIDLIKEFSNSSNMGVSKEMKYRLNKLNA